MGIVFDISGNIHSYFSLPTYFHALDLIRNTMQSIGWNIILTLKSIPSSNWIGKKQLVMIAIKKKLEKKTMIQNTESMSNRMNWNEAALKVGGGVPRPLRASSSSHSSWFLLGRCAPQPPAKTLGCKDRKSDAPLRCSPYPTRRSCWCPNTQCDGLRFLSLLCLGTCHDRHENSQTNKLVGLHSIDSSDFVQHSQCSSVL